MFARVRPRSRSRAATLAVALGGTLLLGSPVAAGAASTVRVDRGGLPAIGAISLARAAGGRAVVSVPVTYRRATRAGAGGERARVTVELWRGVARNGRPQGAVRRFAKVRTLSRFGRVVERFTLPRTLSQRLLQAAPARRGELLRVRVSHEIGGRAGRPLHRKNAAATLASSRRAAPQGQQATLTLVNGTSRPLNNVALPVMCMYDYGQEGSDVSGFNAQQSAIIPPGGTIEQGLQANGNAFSEAEYIGPDADSVTNDVKDLMIAAEVIAAAFGEELPILAEVGGELLEDCDTTASIFSFTAADDRGNGTSGAWVLTSEFGGTMPYKPRLPLLSVFNAFKFQGDGGNPGPQSMLWPDDPTTDAFQPLAGGWWPIGGGRMVQDAGLQWQLTNSSQTDYALTVVPGSNPAGHSGD